MFLWIYLTKDLFARHFMKLRSVKIVYCVSYVAITMRDKKMYVSNENDVYQHRKSKKVRFPKLYTKIVVPETVNWQMGMV